MKNNLIRLSKSIIGEEEKKAVIEVLNNGYLGMGSEVKKFEDNLESFFGRPVACVVNGTAAIHLALEACNIKIGDEVITQSITYVASLQAISATGATPIFCEIDPNTLTLDINDLKKKITSKTKAIVPIHYAGGVGDLENIYNIANENNLRVIEDAAHAFGSSYKNKLIGSFGDIVCFSFDGIKNITSGEGGCIVTDNHQILNNINDSRLLGVEKDTSLRYKNKRSWEFDVKRQGWRYHMSSLMASIGIIQLSRFKEFKLKRAKLVSAYLKLLKNIDSITLLNLDYSNIVMHIFPIILPVNIDRDDLRKYLLENNIETGIHYYPNHLLSLYKAKIPINLKKTEEIYPKLLTLPLHPDLSLDDLIYISTKLKMFIEKNC